MLIPLHPFCISRYPCRLLAVIRAFVALAPARIPVLGYGVRLYIGWASAARVQRSTASKMNQVSLEDSLRLSYPEQFSRLKGVAHECESENKCRAVPPRTKKSYTRFDSVPLTSTTSFTTTVHAPPFTFAFPLIITIICLHQCLTRLSLRLRSVLSLPTLQPVAQLRMVCSHVSLLPSHRLTLRRLLAQRCGRTAPSPTISNRQILKVLAKTMWRRRVQSNRRLVSLVSLTSSRKSELD